jgi:hypothetical protein
MLANGVYIYSIYIRSMGSHDLRSGKRALEAYSIIVHGLEIFAVLSGCIHKLIDYVLVRYLRVAEILVACCLEQWLLVSRRRGTWLWFLTR